LVAYKAVPVGGYFVLSSLSPFLSHCRWRADRRSPPGIWQWESLCHGRSNFVCSCVKL
jgi:hypothetical protein